MPADHSIDYLEFPSRNLPTTRAFFTALMGWAYEDYGPDYLAFDDGRMKGGFFRSDAISSVAEGAPLVVFYHSNLEEQQRRVTELGATVTRAIFSFPGGRRFHFAEPGGSEFAIWSE